MASTEAKAKWFHLANCYVVDEDYIKDSRPPSFIPSSSKSKSEKNSHDLLADTRWWLYQQHKLNPGSFWDPQWETFPDNTLQKKPKLPEALTEDDHLVDFSDEPDKLFSEVESQWIGIKKNEPWWRTADLDEFVSHKSLQYFDNCDLPLPRTNITGWSPCGLDSPFSTTQSDTPNSELSKTQLLEALCHSQRRAREAEKAAQQACNEKEHVITLFLKQASQMFAYKQWLYILQLERICTRFPDLVPWSPTKGKLPKRVHKATKRCKIHNPVGDFFLGLTLVGTGVLLGWTLGWLFPAL